MAGNRRLGRERALRLARDAAAAVDARIAVTEGDGEVYEGPVVWLEYLGAHEETVPIEAQEAALERAAVLLAEQGLVVTFQPRTKGATLKTFVEFCLDPVHDAAIRDLLGSGAPAKPEVATLTATADEPDDVSSGRNESLIAKNLAEGAAATAAMARGLAQLLQVVAAADCRHLQIGLPDTGLVLYAEGAPDAGAAPLQRLGDRLLEVAGTPGEPLHEMPAEVQLEIMARESDFGTIGHTLEIRIIEQPPAGWSVLY
jgi:hypothetical protein